MSRARSELLPSGVEPLALRVGAMAAALSLSEETFKQMREDGVFPPPRVYNGVKLCIVEEYRAALLNLPVEGQGEPILVNEQKRLKVR